MRHVHRSGTPRRQLDVRCRPVHEVPAVGRLANLPHEFCVQAVPGAMRDEVAEHRVTHQREVAHRIENPVTHELVLEAEGVVQHAGLTEHNRIIERAARACRAGRSAGSQTVAPSTASELERKLPR